MKLIWICKHAERRWLCRSANSNFHFLQVFKAVCLSCGIGCYKMFFTFCSLKFLAGLLTTDLLAVGKCE
jgi:hypothetical protein